MWILASAVTGVTCRYEIGKAVVEWIVVHVIDHEHIAIGPAADTDLPADQTMAPSTCVQAGSDAVIEEQP